MRYRTRLRKFAPALIEFATDVLGASARMKARLRQAIVITGCAIQPRSSIFISAHAWRIESSRMSIPPDKPTYENLYSRLQAIVARLEAGELPLAEALALYEEGVTVAAACQRLLDEAELRIQELQPGDAEPRTGLWEE